MKILHRGLITLAIFDINQILNQTGIDRGEKSFVIGGQTYLVRMTSKRYQIFKRNHRCECCGLTGTVMVLQRHRSSTKRAHFNLYGPNKHGVMTMLTKDHIIPVSKGGSDDIDNLRTLCIQCNMVKGNKEITLEELQLAVANWITEKNKNKRAFKNRHQNKDINHDS